MLCEGLCHQRYHHDKRVLGQERVLDIQHMAQLRMCKARSITCGRQSTTRKDDPPYSLLSF